MVHHFFSMSDIVLRLVVNNATARFATGKVESEEFNEGGFKWVAALEKRFENNKDMINFSLRCDSDNEGPWHCEADVGVRIANNTGGYWHWLEQEHVLFDQSSGGWLHKSPYWWSHFTSQAYNINDTVTIEFHIKIISSERRQPIADLPTFASPNRKSDVILKIGDKTLHVSKQLLSIHSPVFDTMFFGEFAEKGKEEVEIKDVVYEEFLDILHLIYLDMEITDRKVPHLLKLADRFQMESVLNLSKKYLTQAKGYDVMKKLILADQYRLDSLRDNCLKSFTNAGNLSKKLKSIPEYANFSDITLAAICHRLVHLTSV